MSRITIIDDDVELTEDLSLVLRREGHAVTARDTYEGALESLAKERPDLLILDVMFPENNTAGFDLARAIRRRRETRDLPVILLTAVNQQFSMDFSPKDIDPEWIPVQEFLEKPVRTPELLEKVRKLLART